MNNLKESNVEWIGKIPENWKIQPLGLYLKERNEKVSDEEFEPLSVTKIGILPQLENAAKSDDHNNRKKVCKNDFVINSRSDRKQSCGLSNFEGSVSLINIVLKVNKYYPQYIKYVLDNNMFAEEFYRNGHGIVADLWTTRYQEMKNIFIPEPNFETQIKIANYLDDKVSKIDKFIEKSNKEIELLNEYLKVKIDYTVKKGLNKSELKETNIKFIGKIPINWNVTKTKYMADSFMKGNGITKEEVFEDGDIQCVRYGEIYSKYENSFSKTFSRTFINNISSPKYINNGDILFTITGELIEEIGKNIVYLGDEKCIVGGDILVLKHSQNPRFMNYALNSISSQKQKSMGKAKLKVVHISALEIGNVLIAISPLKEQEEIADYLDTISCNIDKIIELKQNLIDKLEEYKKSLIYEVVTGKKEI